MQKATCIKTKNTTSTSLLLTFKTKVCEYHERPMRRKKCLNYGHLMKRCRETLATFARCSYQLHSKDRWSSTEVRCCHCIADHLAFSKNCSRLKRETEIIQIQTKKRIPRQKALRKLLRLSPNPELIFSIALKNTSYPTRSKSSTSPKQGSQSYASSGDTSETETSVTKPRVRR